MPEAYPSSAYPKKVTQIASDSVGLGGILGPVYSTATAAAQPTEITGLFGAA